MIAKQKKHIFDLLEKIEKLNTIISMHQNSEEPSALAIEQYRSQKSDLVTDLLGIVTEVIAELSSGMKAEKIDDLIIDREELEKMSLIPEEGDEFFKSLSNTSNYDYAKIYGNFKGLHNTNSMFLMTEGYRDTSFKLLDDLLNDIQIDCLKIDSQIFPIVFLFRHYLELKMKECIRLYKIAKKEINGNEIGYDNTHSLSKLWETLQVYIVEEFGENDAEKSIKLLIEEIEKVDKGSYSFRYPYDKARGNNTSIVFHIEDNKTIDLQNLRDVMQKMSNYFMGTSDKLHSDLDV